jgi:hypothetical protein
MYVQPHSPQSDEVKAADAVDMLERDLDVNAMAPINDMEAIEDMRSTTADQPAKFVTVPYEAIKSPTTQLGSKPLRAMQPSTEVETVPLPSSLSSKAPPGSIMVRLTPAMIQISNMVLKRVQPTGTSNTSVRFLLTYIYN